MNSHPQQPEGWFRGCAQHYLVGRPPYSPGLAPGLATTLGLDGTGHLLDVGTGPGVVAMRLAPHFDRVTGVDPDPDMLDEARAHADRAGVEALWIEASAEDIGQLGLGPVRLATFGQSFHWTDREAVAETVFDLLEPGGSMAMIVHDIDAGSPPAGPGDPPIPHPEMEDLIATYLGPKSDYLRGHPHVHTDRFADAIARTRFVSSRTLHFPGDPAITRDIDGVISGFLSMSWAAPHRFGDRLAEFEAAARALLGPHTPTGRFWDWPGDTAVILATKPG